MSMMLVEWKVGRIALHLYCGLRGAESWARVGKGIVNEFKKHRRSA